MATRSEIENRRKGIPGIPTIVMLAVGMLPGLAIAQHAGGQGAHHGAAQHGLYAGQQTRTVASFSDEEVAGHLAGRGLGYARPAELNGYPGPMHVLELKTELGLTLEQTAATEALFRSMLARAQAAGRSYVDAEIAVDAAFKSGTADAATLAGLVRAADARRAENRLAHLEAHIEMARILSAEQRASYSRLRGYAAPGKN